MFKIIKNVHLIPVRFFSPLVLVLWDKWQSVSELLEMQDSSVTYKYRNFSSIFYVFGSLPQNRKTLVSDIIHLWHAVMRTFGVGKPSLFGWSRSRTFGSSRSRTLGPDLAPTLIWITVAVKTVYKKMTFWGSVSVYPKLGASLNICCPSTLSDFYIV